MMRDLRFVVPQRQSTVSPKTTSMRTRGTTHGIRTQCARGTNLIQRKVARLGFDFYHHGATVKQQQRRNGFENIV